MPTDGIVVMVTGFSRAQWGGAPLPMSLAGLGMPGCDLCVSPEVLEPIVASGNTASYTIALPSDPGLLGGEFHQQGLVFDDMAGNAFGATMTNAATAVIGN